MSKASSSYTASIQILSFFVLTLSFFFSLSFSFLAPFPFPLPRPIPSRLTSQAVYIPQYATSCAALHRSITTRQLGVYPWAYSVGDKTLRSIGFGIKQYFSGVTQVFFFVAGFQSS